MNWNANVLSGSDFQKKSINFIRFNLNNIFYSCFLGIAMPDKYRLFD